MKKILLLSAMSLMATATLCAQGAAATRSGDRATAPAYLTPGAEQAIDQLNAVNNKAALQMQSLQDARNARAAKAKALAGQAAAARRPAGVKPAAAVAPDNIVRVAGTALDASPRFAIAQRDTVLVTSYDYIAGDQTETRATVEYDQFGYRTMLTEGDNLTRYTYTVDAQGRWTSRTLESSVKGSDTWEPVSKQERTIEGDFVTTITTYGINYAYDGSGNYCPTLFKQTFYEFEYRKDQASYVYDGSEIAIADAAMTHVVEYDPEGTTVMEMRYTWVEQLGYYVTTYSLSDWSKVESEFGSDYITVITYYKNYSDDTWYKGSAQKYLLGKIVGTIFINYKTTGEIEYAWGYGDETYTNEDGDIVRISYDYDSATDTMNQQSKYVYSPNYDAPYEYDRDFAWWYASYSYVGGEWTLDYANQFSFKLLGNGLGQVTQTQESSYYSYTQTYTVMPEKVYNEYAELGYYWELYYATVNDDNSYIVTKGYNGDDGYGYTYLYYSANGTLLREIRQLELPTGGYSFMVREAGSDQWSMLDEWTVTEQEDGLTYRTVYRTGADGRPASSTTYVAIPGINDGNEFKFSEVIYTYKDNGDYLIETYEVYNPLDVTKMTLTLKEELTTLDDGTKQYTSLEYADDGTGTVEYGSRRTVKDYVVSYYSLDTTTGQWSLSYSYCEDETYITDDGTEVTISRSLSDDGTTVSLDYKSETRRVETTLPGGIFNSKYYSSRYSWDAGRNDWRGTDRYETDSYECDFTYDDASNFDPISAYDDEYIIAPAANNYYTNGFYESASNSWSWDETAWAWVLDGEMRTVNVALDGQTITVATTTHREYDTADFVDLSETTSYTRDSQGRLAAHEVLATATSTTGGQQIKTFEHYRYNYSYNEECGLLAEKNVAYLDENGQTTSSETYRYNYTRFTVQPAAVDESLADAADALTIVGGEAVAPGQAISVYTTGGILVATAADRVALPTAAGVYVVKAAGAAVKVAVR